MFFISIVSGNLYSTSSTALVEYWLSCVTQLFLNVHCCLNKEDHLQTTAQ